MPKTKRKYIRRKFGTIEKAQREAGIVPARPEPWNEPTALIRDAADTIKRYQHRLEIADAKLEMVYLFATLIRRDDRNVTRGELASQEGIVSRLERFLAPVPAKSTSKHL